MSQANNPPTVLELREVLKVFPGHHPIGPFSLKVPSGTFLTLLGPSGCGKTTILRIIAGLEAPDQGRVFLSGNDITNLSVEKRPIHTIFQNYSLFPHMTVWENVAFGLRMQKRPLEEIKPRVSEALQWVQLEQFSDRFPSNLSGGQQQRVSIARAAVNRPKVLLLDESLSALDKTLRRRMQNELKALQRQLGITFISVTHDQEEALSMADQIVVMREGQIEQSGRPREIYEKPANLFVAQFIGESNLFSAQVLRVVKENSIAVEIEGATFILNVASYLKRCSETSVKSLIGQRLQILLRPEDLRIEEVSDEEPTRGMIGYIRERNYRGMTLDSSIELQSGRMVTASEFFNEDDPDVDHSLHQKVSVTWVANWEVILANEAE